MGNVNEILAMNMEGIKSENPELKKVINIFILKLFYNGLIFVNIVLSHFILIFNESTI